MIPGFQMRAGHPFAQFPRRIADHPLPTRHFTTLLPRAIPLLRYLEKMTHPRWHPVLEVTKRLVGILVVILSGVVVFAPIPLMNVIPSLVIALISLAYREGDGLVLLIGLFAAVVIPAIAVVAVRETVRGAKWLGVP
jgi:hypothetical protein